MDLTDFIVFGVIFGLLAYAAYVYYTNAMKTEKEKEEIQVQQQRSTPPSQPKSRPAPKSFKVEKQKKEKIPAISFGISQRIISYCLTQHYLVILCGDKAIRVLKRECYNDAKQAVQVPTPGGILGESVAALPKEDKFCAIMKGNKGLSTYSLSTGESEKPQCELVDKISFNTTDPVATPYDFVFLRPGYSATCRKSQDFVRLWDSTGQQVGSYKFSQGGIDSLAVSPDGAFISAGCFTSESKIVSVTRTRDSGTITGCVQASYTTEHRSRILCVTFSADSTRLFTVSKDGTWKKWDITGDLKKRDPVAEITGVVPPLFLDYLNSPTSKQKHSAAADNQKGGKKSSASTQTQNSTPKFEFPVHPPNTPFYMGVLVNDLNTIMILWTEFHAFVINMETKSVIKEIPFIEPAQQVLYLDKECTLLAFNPNTNRIVYYEKIHPEQKKKR